MGSPVSTGRFFCRSGGNQGLISEGLIKVGCAGLAGGEISPGRKCAEFNLTWAGGPWQGFYDLRHGRRLGVGIRGLRCPGCKIGKPGQSAKIKCRHAFLLNGLHLQGIFPAHAGPGTAVSKNVG